MDGVSIAASIIGIGAAGSQIAIKLYTLATQISTASERISSISNDVFSTSAVLQQLGELMTTTSMHDGTTIFSQGGLDTTRTSAAMCETIFKDIEHAAREASEQLRGRSRFTGGKIKLSRSERLKWPFLQPSIDTLRNDLREAKSTLMLMLHVTLLAFSKKMAEIHQTTSKNIVEQREIIDAILVYQKQQHRSQCVEAQAQPLSSSSSGGDNLKAVISNTDGETSSRADENSTLAQCRSSDSATLLPLRLNNVLMAMPPPKTLNTKTTSTKSASSRIGQSITADGDACDPQPNYEDYTTSASGQSSLHGGGMNTPTESTVGQDAEGIHNLTFFLMKPIIKDLGEVIQLSWKVHNFQMQQAEIRNQVIKNEKEGLPLVHEVCQGLHAHEHAALEGLIAGTSAGFNVSLQSLKRIYIDMKHRDILFKGVPGLEFVLERTVLQPLPQTNLSLQAQSAASAQPQPSNFGQMTTFQHQMAPRRDHHVPLSPNEQGPLSSVGPHQTLRRKQRMRPWLAGGISDNYYRTSSQAHEDGADSHNDLDGNGWFAGADAKRRRAIHMESYKKRVASSRRCHACNIKETPEWRRGPDGAGTLCDACGIQYAKATTDTGIMRPNAIQTIEPFYETPHYHVPSSSPPKVSLSSRTCGMVPQAHVPSEEPTMQSRTPGEVMRLRLEREAQEKAEGHDRHDQHQIIAMASTWQPPSNRNRSWQSGMSPLDPGPPPAPFAGASGPAINSHSQHNASTTPAEYPKRHTRPSSAEGPAVKRTKLGSQPSIFNNMPRPLQQRLLKVPEDVRQRLLSNPSQQPCAAQPQQQQHQEQQPQNKLQQQTRDQAAEMTTAGAVMSDKVPMSIQPSQFDKASFDQHRAASDEHRTSSASISLPAQDIPPNIHDNSIDYSEDDEDDEDIIGRGMNENEADRIVKELLERYTTLFEASGKEGGGK